MPDTEKGDVKPKTFSFQWTIERFFSCSKKVGDAYTSPVFPITYGGKTTEWFLRIYPKGIREENKDFISVFLVYKSKNVSEVTMDFQLSIVNEKNATDLCKWTHTTFNNKSVDDWGWKMFVEQDFIKDTKNGALVDGKLTISCKITFVQKREIFKGYDKCLNKIQKGFDEYETLLEDKSFSDVTFDIQGKKMHLHKNILSCRNSVFKAMFQHEMKENKQNVVDIVDIDYIVMKELFRFIYSGKVNNIEKIAKKLLIAADKYSVTELKASCENTLYESLTVDNVIEFLALVNMCDTLHLKKLVVQFVVDNLTSIVQKSDFKLLLADLDRDIVYEIMQAVALKD